jgi:hypothetical protein
MTLYLRCLINIATLSLAILTNTTLLQDLNQHLPVLGPSLLEIGKSVENSNQMMYVWDRIVKFFLGNQTTVSLDKRSGFLNVSGGVRKSL